MTNKTLNKQLAIILIAIALAFCIKLFVIEVFQIMGNSMLPAYESGDRVLVLKISLISRGDAVAILMPDKSKYLLKRIIGLPGDRVVVWQDGTSITFTPDGQRWFYEGDLYIDPITSRVQTSDIIIPKGYCYVMGDNRVDSLDSREMGPLPLDYIEGEVAFTF